MSATGRPADPYTLALTWLSRRELSEAQVRQRLQARAIPADAVDDAVGRLRRERALDDRRVALAAARTDARVNRRGPRLVHRRLAGIGIAPDLAAEALAAVFGEEGESPLVEAAAEALLGRHPGRDLDDPGTYRRTFAALVRRGFSPSTVGDVLRARRRSRTRDEPPE